MTMSESDFHLHARHPVDCGFPRRRAKSVTRSRNCRDAPMFVNESYPAALPPNADFWTSLRAWGNARVGSAAPSLAPLRASDGTENHISSQVQRRRDDEIVTRRSKSALVVREQHARLRAMVDDHIHIVARILRKAGVPPSDLDDEIQRTFMVAAARLEVVRRGSERSFLCQVAYNVASHARRRLARRREILDDNPPERIEAVATPEYLTDRKQLRKLLDEILGSLHESLRVVFTLFELEDMNLVAISKALGLPRGTVASRLRRARAQLRAHAAAVDLGELRPDDPTEMAEPTLLRRERVSALQAAILAAGARAGVPATTHAKTLEALGVEPGQPDMPPQSRVSYAAGTG